VATPQLQQYGIFTGNPVGVGDTGRAFVFTTQNAVGAGNCIVLAVTVPVAATTVTITDNNGNSWPSAAITESGGSGNYKLLVFVLPNANAGITTITIGIGTTNRLPIFWEWYEWNNIATSSPVDVSHGAANQSGTSLACGSMTTTVAGDLILAFYHLSSTAGGNPTGWTAGSGFTLLGASIEWVSAQGLPKASQYQIQSSAGAINPTISIAGDSGDSFNCAAVALKSASAGTQYGSAIRLLGQRIFSNNGSPTSPWKLQCSMFGNLRATWTTLAQNNWDITSITDSESNTWTPEVPKPDGCQCFFLQNAAVNNSLTVNINFSGTVGSGASNVRIYDIINAATSGQPGTVVGNDLTSASSVTSVANQPAFTPTANNSLVCLGLNNENGPTTGITSPTGAVFLNAPYTGETDLGFINFGDGHAIWYSNSTSAQNATWSIKSVSGNSVAGMAVEFLAAPTVIVTDTPASFLGITWPAAFNLNQSLLRGTANDFSSSAVETNPHWMPHAFPLEWNVNLRLVRTRGHELSGSAPETNPHWTGTPWPAQWTRNPVMLRTPANDVPPFVQLDVPASFVSAWRPAAWTPDRRLNENFPADTSSSAIETNPHWMPRAWPTQWSINVRIAYHRASDLNASAPETNPHWMGKPWAPQWTLTIALLLTQETDAPFIPPDTPSYFVPIQFPLQWGLNPALGQNIAADLSTSAVETDYSYVSSTWSPQWSLNYPLMRGTAQDLSSIPPVVIGYHIVTTMGAKFISVPGMS
jgi:hypothetical protein